VFATDIQLHRSAKIDAGGSLLATDISSAAVAGLINSGKIFSSLPLQDKDLFALRTVTNGDMPIPNTDVDANAVLIRGTYAADMNLDGKVDDTDVTIFNAFYHDPSAAGKFYMGDLDGSGVAGDDMDVTLFGAVW